MYTYPCSRTGPGDSVPPSASRWRSGSTWCSRRRRQSGRPARTRRRRRRRPRQMSSTPPGRGTRRPSFLFTNDALDVREKGNWMEANQLLLPSSSLPLGVMLQAPPPPFCLLLPPSFLPFPSTAISFLPSPLSSCHIFSHRLINSSSRKRFPVTGRNYMKQCGTKRHSGRQTSISRFCS